MYGKEVVLPMEFTIPNLRIATFSNMNDSSVEVERMLQLLELEEDRFIA